MWVWVQTLAEKERNTLPVCGVAQPSVFSVSFQIKFFEKYPVLLGLIFPAVIDSWYSSIYMIAYFFFSFPVFFLPSLTFHLKCIFFLKYFVFSINVVHFILVFGWKHLCCWAFFICFVYLMYLYFPVCLLFVLYNKFILSWFYCFF